MFSIYSGGKCLETCVHEEEKQFALEAWRGLGWENLEARPMVQAEKEFRSVEEIKAEKEWRDCGASEWMSKA